MLAAAQIRRLLGERADDLRGDVEEEDGGNEGEGENKDDEGVTAGMKGGV